MMVAGAKSVTLFRPNRNVELYEGHMREAILDFDTHSGVRSPT